MNDFLDKYTKANSLISIAGLIICISCIRFFSLNLYEIVFLAFVFGLNVIGVFSSMMGIYLGSQVKKEWYKHLYLKIQNHFPGTDKTRLLFLTFLGMAIFIKMICPILIMIVKISF